MKLTWLHISDIHLDSSDSYDQHVVLTALVRAVKDFRQKHRLAPDLIFFTGDIAYHGREAQYQPATRFFDDLLNAAGLERRCLFLVPGNHDVDRRKGSGLAPTLQSEEVDQYFASGQELLHITQKQQAFTAWYDQYFAGIRSHPKSSSCGPVELAEVGGCRVGILPLNSALFSVDDKDRDKLWIGRPALDAALRELNGLGAQLKIALIHHPLEWLHPEEQGKTREKLHKNVDLILRGHLHENTTFGMLSPSGVTLYLAAGAAYQTQKYPKRALYGSFDGERVTIIPIRYEDQPNEVWTLDTSLFPDEPGYTWSVPIRSAPVTPEIEPAVKPVETSRFRCNIYSRLKRPFMGREGHLREIRRLLGDLSRESVLVLKGQAGVGKSELAREFARENAHRYPGGTFFVDAGSSGPPLGLIQIGTTQLGLHFKEGPSVEDRCYQTLYALGSQPTLLIYDNVASPKAIRPWLPTAGMACHVLITSVSDRWDPLWQSLTVEPLPLPTSLALITQITEKAGPAVGQSHRSRLAAMSGGLPIQICPAAAALCRAAERGRLGSFALEITSEAQSSFRLVCDQLDPNEKLLLQAAAFLNGQQLLESELSGHLRDAAGWSELEFLRHLGGCLNLHLLNGAQELQMNQLLGRFVLESLHAGDAVKRVRSVQWQSLVGVAKALVTNPADKALIHRLRSYSLTLDAWERAGVVASVEEAEVVGQALSEIGMFAEARPWYERAVTWKEQEGADGQSLGDSLHQVGFCLAGMRDETGALPWYKRAVQTKQQGDREGQVNQDSLSSSLHEVGTCLLHLNEVEEALPWFEGAVEAGKIGNLEGRIHYESLGTSLHEVGVCLFGMERYEDALSSFEQAVKATQQGDIDGRINQESLGKSLHQVGICLFRMGRYDTALESFKDAAEAIQKGDNFGRVDHESLGKSRHRVGLCLLELEGAQEALSWFERAVEAKQQGDHYGRIDPESLRISLESGANCLEALGRPEEAEAWRARAAELKPEG